MKSEWRLIGANHSQANDLLRQPLEHDLGERQSHLGHEEYQED